MNECTACGQSRPEDALFCPHCGTAVPRASAFQPGTQLGMYRLVRRLGEGGMGVVFEAEHSELGRKVALKVLTVSGMDSEEASLRFRREARLASRINHPNAVTIHDFFHTPDGLPCLIMELIKGKPLRQVIESDGPFPVSRAVRVADEVLEVLEVAHAIGLVHRDIKSRNIMLLVNRRFEQVKVLDFGIAKMVDATEGTGMTPLTKAGMVLGSPQYMSPEQSRGDPVDERSDLYSLGIVMYEMLTGHVPFDSTNPMDILVQQVRVKPPPLPAETIPSALSKVIDRALAKEPDQRYPNARSFRAGLSESRTAQRAAAGADTRELTAAKLLPLGGDPAVPIRGRIRIGRGSENEIVPSGRGAEKVSSKHAEVFWRNGQLWVRDLDSTNGTYVNGRRVSEARIRGSSLLRLARGGPAYRIEIVGDRSPLRRVAGPAMVWLTEKIGGLVGLVDELRGSRGQAVRRQ